jgi:hypothetical protein
MCGAADRREMITAVMNILTSRPVFLISSSFNFRDEPSADSRPFDETPPRRSLPCISPAGEWGD